MANFSLKICGINDASFAARAAKGADYLGFIFEPSSPRFVTPGMAKSIIASCKDPFMGVAVFARQSLEEILSTVRDVKPAVVQIHRETTPEDAAAIRGCGCRLWSLGGVADGILVDSPKPGSGTLSDWSRVRDLASAGVFTIIAGGLSAKNIKDAALTGASVLDVNSSLETSPGCKSVRKLEELLSAISRG